MAEDLIPSPTPLTPPHSEEEKLFWLRLLRSRRVGISTFYRLMREHGDAAAALDALPGVARDSGLTDYRPCPEEVAAHELRAGRLSGARLLTVGMPDYPAALLDLTDPPPILWALGNTDLAARPGAAMVGARNASSLGLRMARRMAEDLGAAGYVVTSGLARGVDTAAHLAALRTGTIAVMAGGVDVVYPAENAVLAQEIGETGLRLTEQPMGLQPQARHFPRRNRLIAALARGVVVVEATAKSGSLITARDALDIGRDVLAVPGHPFDARAAGCNMLLRDGATLVRNAADVLEALGPAEAACPAPPQPDLPLPDTGADPDGSVTRDGRGQVVPLKRRRRQDARPAADPAAPAHHDETAPDDAARSAGAGTRATSSRSGPSSTAGPRVSGPSSRGAGAGSGQSAPNSRNRDLHADILSHLGASPVLEDHLIRDIGLSAGRVLPEIVTLELQGRIERHPGGFLSRLPDR